MNGLLWQLWDRFVLFLASLNPTTKAKVEELKAETVELEAERKQLLAKVEEGKQKNVSLLLELTENNRKTIKLENAILHSKEQVALKIAELNALSEHDKVRVDL